METTFNKSFENRKKRLARMIDDKSSISKKHKILPEQFSALKEYDRQNQLRQLAVATRAMYLYHLQYFAERIKKPFDKIERKDIEDFLLSMENLSQSSQIKMRTCIKCFFRYFYKCEDDTYPPVVKWIKSSRRIIKTTQPQDLLTQEEIKKMLETADHPRTLALIHTLAESGARVGEISNTRIKDVIFDDYGAIIHVDGKTGRRPIRLIDCVPSMREWLNKHPEKDNPEAPLFINLGKNQYGGGLSEIGIQMIVKLLAKRAGIKKNVYPHLFRHTSATKFSKEGYNEFFMRKRFGWSPHSDMPEHYTSMSGVDVDNVMLVKKGLKKTDSESANGKTLEAVKCKRCTETNSPANIYCGKCGFDLKEDYFRKDEQTEHEFMSAINSHPLIKEAYAKVSKDMEFMKAVAQKLAKIK